MTWVLESRQSMEKETSSIEKFIYILNNISSSYIKQPSGYENITITIFAQPDYGYNVSMQMYSENDLSYTIYSNVGIMWTWGH